MPLFPTNTCFLHEPCVAHTPCIIRPSTLTLHVPLTRPVYSISHSYRRHRLSDKLSRPLANARAPRFASFACPSPLVPPIDTFPTLSRPRRSAVNVSPLPSTVCSPCILRAAYIPPITQPNSSALHATPICFARPFLSPFRCPQ